MRQNAAKIFGGGNSVQASTGNGSPAAEGDHPRVYPGQAAIDSPETVVHVRGTQENGSEGKKAKSAREKQSDSSEGKMALKAPLLLHMGPFICKSKQTQRLPLSFFVSFQQLCKLPASAGPILVVTKPLPRVLLIHTGGTLGMDPAASFEPDEDGHMVLKEGTGGSFKGGLRPGELPPCRY